MECHLSSSLLLSIVSSSHFTHLITCLYLSSRGHCTPSCLVSSLSLRWSNSVCVRERESAENNWCSQVEVYSLRVFSRSRRAFEIFERVCVWISARNLKGSVVWSQCVLAVSYQGCFTLQTLHVCVWERRCVSKRVALGNLAAATGLRMNWIALLRNLGTGLWNPYWALWCVKTWPSKRQPAVLLPFPIILPYHNVP